VKAAAPLDSLSLAELELLAEIEDSLIAAIQRDSSDVGAIAELAHLYMLHGAYDAAVGPLARALELMAARPARYGRYSSGNVCFSVTSFGKSLNTMYG